VCKELLGKRGIFFYSGDFCASEEEEEEEEEEGKQRAAAAARRRGYVAANFFLLCQICGPTLQISVDSFLM
jgi:hypothetical protein